MVLQKIQYCTHLYKRKLCINFLMVCILQKIVDIVNRIIGLFIVKLTKKDINDLNATNGQ
ncbi:hypothetical protein BpHYR1_038417 [Brachionus plicatilis]|uniref:Uncharacterized protein n=1 Tax=Brachionus plicatilis TaxID=10195 RepID=A0A3M7PP00_BRAPC|nr:hypothetical protein BpHYR1_038417 [Brachionus plicatilis]